MVTNWTAYVCTLWTPTVCAHSAMKKSRGTYLTTASWKRHILSSPGTLCFLDMYVYLKYDACLPFLRLLQTNQLTTVESGLFDNLGLLVAM